MFREIMQFLTINQPWGTFAVSLAGYLWAAFQFFDKRYARFHLFFKSLVFKGINKTTYWNCTFRFTIGNNNSDQLVSVAIFYKALREQFCRFEDYQVLAQSGSLIKLFANGVLYTAVYDVSDNIVTFSISDIRIGFRDARKFFDDTLMQVIETVETTLSNPQKQLSLTVKFSEKFNPYLSEYIRRDKDRAIKQFELMYEIEDKNHRNAQVSVYLSSVQLISFSREGFRKNAHKIFILSRI